MRARAAGSPCLKEWLVPYFRNTIKYSEDSLFLERLTGMRRAHVESNRHFQFLSLRGRVG